MVAVLVLASCGSAANNGYEDGPWVFVSGEGPDYIVNLGVTPYVGDDGKIAYRKQVLKTTLPRDLLSICFPYSRRDAEGPFKVDRLPDEVFCNKIGFAMFYDDGKPAWRGKSREERDLVRNRTSDPLVFGKVPSATYREHLDVERFAMISADVFPIGPGWTGTLLDRRNPLPYRQKTGEYEGFDEYRANSVTSVRIYNDADASDGITYVECPAPIEKSNPVFYCTASIKLNDQIGAELRFIDFRLHGGRVFLRERIAAWKSLMCGAFRCN